MNFLEDRVWFKFKPTIDTAVAFITAFIMIGAYYFQTHMAHDSIFTLIYSILMFSLLVIFPVWWMIWHRGYSFSEMGITRQKWAPSLLISAVLFIVFGIFIWVMYANSGKDVLNHVIMSAINLWEPIFVFAWLQMRFDRAFGIVPGILLASTFFAAYHIGTFPLYAIPFLFMKEIVLTSTFRLTSNLLIIWPLAWSTASALGTLWGPLQFSMQTIGVFAMIFLIQVAFLIYTFKTKTPAKA